MQLHLTLKTQHVMAEYLFVVTDIQHRTMTTSQYFPPVMKKKGIKLNLKL